MSQGTCKRGHPWDRNTSGSCRPCTNEARRRRRRALRERAVEIYGGACAWCGESDLLEFDHVNNDGPEHRAWENEHKMIARIAGLGRPLPDVELQLLCKPHHQAKTFDGLKVA